MVCPDSEVLARYLSEETDPQEAEAVRRHVDGCAACRDGIAADRALEGALGRLEPLGPTLSPGGCLDTMTLAALLDARLPEAERARAVDHLAHCGSCLDDLVSAAQREIPPSRAVPDRLAAQARALEQAPARRPRAAMLRPAWPWAAALGAAVVAGSVLWPRGSPPPMTPKGGPGSSRWPDKPLGLSGPGFARRPLSARTDLQAGGIVRVDAVLARALRRYQEGPTVEARGELLRALEEGPLKIPAARVATIQIRPGVLARVQADPSTEARVQLLEGGHLLVEEP